MERNSSNIWVLAPDASIPNLSQFVDDKSFFKGLWEAALLGLIFLGGYLKKNLGMVLFLTFIIFTTNGFFFL